METEYIPDMNKEIPKEKVNYDQIISDLFVKYECNQYMTQKLTEHLLNLPELMEQENKKHEEKLQKYNELLFEQDNFFKIFLSKNQYYYMPFNSIYYEYIDNTFKTITNDDIYHKLLSTITDEGKLIQWKHKTKQIMIKKIKERLLLKAIPESETIQHILNMLKTFFDTKSDAKYFLTLIGDCILKKNTSNLYFVSSSVKKIVSLIDSVCYITTGSSILSNFITKYHDTHNLTNYRLIKNSNTLDTISFDIIKNMINNYGIDLIVVACHYSEQFTCADNYLPDTDCYKYTMYFVDNSIDKIVQSFIQTCIESVVNSNEEHKITWNNMHYIWKLYLTSIQIPNPIYSSNLQNLLVSLLPNTSVNDNITFINITSKYLPNVSSFLSFWDKYIVIEQSKYEYDYELEELFTLYKSSEFRVIGLNETTFINMIQHYYSGEVDILENKYITNIRCELWNKETELNGFLQYFKEIICDEKIVSFDELYQKYRNYNKTKPNDKKVSLLISKQYFEKYLLSNLSNCIQFEKFLNITDLLVC